MPADSPCIGVDLAPIKPVTKCIALQEDITSQRCRVAIRRHLLDAKVDVVLHDGAPNVGTSWLQDAYGQNELTIFAYSFLASGAKEFCRADTPPNNFWKSSKSDFDH